MNALIKLYYTVTCQEMYLLRFSSPNCYVMLWLVADLLLSVAIGGGFCDVEYLIRKCGQ